jgi:hypothetical protein
MTPLRVGPGRPPGGYELADGSRPLSASQIADALDTPDKREALQRWYAYEGKHAFRIAEEAQQVGSAVHAAIERRYIGQPDPTCLWDSPDHIAAESAYAAFERWHAVTPHAPLLIEWPLVSERLRLAGTLDMLAVFDGPEIVDFKTSKRLSPRSMVLQCAVYDLLVSEELPDMPDRVGCRIVRLPKDGTGYRETRCDGAAWRDACRAARMLVEAMQAIAAVDALRECPELPPVEIDDELEFGP